MKNYDDLTPAILMEIAGQIYVNIFYENKINENFMLLQSDQIKHAIIRAFTVYTFK